MDKKDKNFLDKLDERQAKIEAIVDKNEMEDVVSYAEMGSPEAIQDRFFRVPPQYGGFSDLAQHEDLIDDVNALIEERLEEAKEKGEDINNWSLYESVGQEIRKDALEYDHEGIYKEPGPTVEDKLQEERFSAISDMAKARNQGV